VIGNKFSRLIKFLNGNGNNNLTVTVTQKRPANNDPLLKPFATLSQKYDFQFISEYISQSSFAYLLVLI
jgi:hypothetical protein